MFFGKIQKSIVTRGKTIFDIPYHSINLGSDANLTLFDPSKQYTLELKHLISTSKNWAIWLHEYLQDFENMQDSLRYTITVNCPENKDNDFTWKDFQSRNNNELVVILGNYINRVFVLTEKYFDNVVPEYEKIDSDQC